MRQRNYNLENWVVGILIVMVAVLGALLILNRSASAREPGPSPGWETERFTGLDLKVVTAGKSGLITDLYAEQPIGNGITLTYKLLWKSKPALITAKVLMLENDRRPVPVTIIGYRVADYDGDGILVTAVSEDKPTAPKRTARDK